MPGRQSACRGRPGPLPSTSSPAARRGHLALVAVAVLMMATMGLPGVRGAQDHAHEHARPVTIVVSQTSPGRISRDIFGSNLLWPYDAEGAFDRATGTFYPAFVKQVRQLGVTALRYPAGITSDSFDWLRAIGPQAKRKPNEPYGMQMAYFSPSCCKLDNPAASTVGPDQFGQLLGQLGAVGNITVNFATGTPTEAADFVAYMTAPEGEQPSAKRSQPGYWAAQRAANGHPAPYDVPYWEVGNEQDSPGQFGWRSGLVVSVGAHKGRCPRGQVKVCLYAFGGTTSFYQQTVGRSANDRLLASYSSGEPRQHFFVYYPPVVPKSEVVLVNGGPWRLVHNLGHWGRRARVYTFNGSTGEIDFGNGVHGAIPPKDALITATYDSGPHGGFVEFYRAMKKMGPKAQICESEEGSTVFLQLMGKAYPYGCVELHKYARPGDIFAPLAQYEEALMRAPIVEGAAVTRLQHRIRHYSGKDIPVVLTEYGQLVEPMPVNDPAFDLSLDEGLLVAAQLRQWVDHRLPLAEKYLLNSTPFMSRNDSGVALAIDTLGLSVDNSMIAGPGPDFVVEPTGEVLGLMSQLGGAWLLGSSVKHNPVMRPRGGYRTPVLQVVAARSGRQLDLVVINTSPLRAVTARVDLGHWPHAPTATCTLLDGASPTSYNSWLHPRSVTTTTSSCRTGDGPSFDWVFPAHSLVLFKLAAPSPSGPPEGYRHPHADGL